MKKTIDIFNLQDQNGMPAEYQGIYLGSKSDICRHKNVKLELKTTWIKVYGCLVILNDTPHTLEYFGTILESAASRRYYQHEQ